LWLLGLLSLLLHVQLICATASHVPTGSHLDSRGFLTTDETSRLIIGLYELPKDDEKLKQIAENGFNLVRVPQDTKALDRVHKHGLYAWICLGSAVKLSQDGEKEKQKLINIVDDFKGHPALLVWELPDEVVWNIWWSKFPWVFGGQQRALRKHVEKAAPDISQNKIAMWRSLLEKAEDYNHRGLWEKAEQIYDKLWAELEMKNPHPDRKMSQCPEQSQALAEAVARGCRVLRQRDSQHIIWQNHAPRNSVKRLREYNQCVDAAGCDIYPVPFNYGVGHSDLKDTNLTAVGAYTGRMRRAAPGKSIWMVLQGFGWRDLSDDPEKDTDPQKGRRPNFRETRFMAYDAIVHGANAILYWGTHYIEKDSLLWRDLMKIARELRALEPAILGRWPKTVPLSVADETYGSIDGQGPRLMLRKTKEDWVLIAVNECSQGVSFTISGLPEETEGRTLYRLYSDESRIVRQRSISDGIRGFGVHVYATSRSFEGR
jgi:hypothetical protein